VLGRITLDGRADWEIARAGAKKPPAGVHDLFLTQAAGETVDVDWVRFR
jgi:hypothetical protein